ncbi:hypothetical protein D9613_009252 [Agrocybe pediades]|uniref:C2H2-type domain-containing protein n=1 Tax=Agrocybe pediades TaxID=84607 RepID=A0A8H4VTA6_9AGAR|nr:hypothetical protein D9613_009252 [Agrocybe pediades]
MPKGQRRAPKSQPTSALAAEPGLPPPPPPGGLAVAVSPPTSPSSTSSIENITPDTYDRHGAGEGSHTVSASRPDSPSMEDQDIDDSVTCLWEDCGIVFTHLPTLISHIHDEHIGVHKSNYTCEWATCGRRGLPQTSRRPVGFLETSVAITYFPNCPAECDKSFTRSDALAKHMRVQHNIDPPAPGRGGSRKRKRGAGEDTPGTTTPVGSMAAASISANTSGFNKFRLESKISLALVSGDRLNESGHEYLKAGGSSIANGRAKRAPKPSPLHGQHTPSLVDPDDDAQALEEDDIDDSEMDELPPSLMAHYDESTGLVMGRTPAKAMYLVMKAKSLHAMKEREKLSEQLKVMQQEAERETKEKDNALDALLQRLLGPESGVLTFNEDPRVPPLSYPPPPPPPHPSYMAPGPSSAPMHEGYRQIRPPPPYAMQNGGPHSVSTTSRGR